MGRDVVIVEVLLPQAEAVLLQSLLQGEDGLATIRCLDPEKKRQQFWTTAEQLDDLYQWLDSLPNTLHVEVTDEWRWQEGSREELWEERQGESR
ncbi:MAG: DUF4911 domain-containing protein [Mariprofundaceae bacterium]|nr:DUF4911 domain-containing protein [Mariprofundaceae bacterium]